MEADAAFWRAEAERRAEELDEFVEGSKELEESLEAELQSKEKLAAEQQNEIGRMKDALDALRARSGASGGELTKAQSELAETVAKLNELRKRCVHLEQSNDEHESRERQREATIEDLRAKLDEAIENSVYLQNDLDETRETSQTALQRALEEKRDLQDELRARDARAASVSSTDGAESATLRERVGELTAEIEAESERNVALSKEVDELTDELMSRKSPAKVAALESESAQLREKNTELLRDIEQLTEDLMAKSGEQSAAAATIARLEAEVAAGAVQDQESTANEVKRLGDALAAAEEGAAAAACAADERAAQDEVRIKVLGAELATLTRERNDLKTSLGDATAKAVTKAASYAAENEELLKMELSALTAERDELRASLSAAKLKIVRPDAQDAMADVNKLRAAHATEVAELKHKAQLEAARARKAESHAHSLAEQQDVQQQIALQSIAVGDRNTPEVDANATGSRIASLRFAYSQQLKANSALLARVQQAQKAAEVTMATISAKNGAHGSGGVLRGHASPNTVVKALSSSEVSFYNDRQRAWRPFAFDRVFPPSDAQDDLRREMLDLRIAESVVGGAHCCVMPVAYGQTGSGKTYTMEGPRGAPGVNEALLKQLFAMTSALTADDGSVKLDVRVGLLEIYNEVVRDLLVDRPQPRKTTTLSSDLGDGSESVTSSSTAKHSPSSKLLNKLSKVVLAKGRANRATASTDMNDASSRSHSIVIVQVRQIVASVAESMGVAFNSDDDSALTSGSDINHEETISATADHAAGGGSKRERTAADSVGLPSRASGDDANLRSMEGKSTQGHQVSTLGQLYLVDLAGSERVIKSRVEGARLAEAKAINKSLSALGDVLEALDSKRPHVPFRNSKLTMVLRPCLSKNARCVMLLTVPPSANVAGETLNSLQFAQRARNIELGPATAKVNMMNERIVTKGLQEQLRKSMRDKSAADSEAVSLRRDVARFKKQLAAAHTRTALTESKKIAQLEQRATIAATEQAKLSTRLGSVTEAKVAAEVEARALKSEMSKVKEAHAKSLRSVHDLTRRTEVQERELRRLRALASAAVAGRETGGGSRHQRSSSWRRMLTPSRRRASSKSDENGEGSEAANSAGAESGVAGATRDCLLPPTPPATDKGSDVTGAESETSPARSSRIPRLTPRKTSENIQSSSASTSTAAPAAERRVTRAAAAAARHAERMQRSYNLRSRKKR